ncbi:MAG: lipoprotein insertase outer membrane protein LolB [Ectothiorhodospiraceae bacterium]|jgi:outer membrane lipoprotein LolB
MRRLGGILLAAALTVFVAGCATAPPEPTGPVLANWTGPDVPADWALLGRAAVDTGGRSGTVTVRWKQNDGNYRVDMRAPLGAGAVRIEGNGSHVVVRTSDGERYEGRSARTLLSRHTGYDLPVESLAWWVRGVPAPGHNEVILDGRGRPTELMQSGWRVSYSSWERVHGYWLPAKLAVERGDIKVRMAVRRWDV